MEKTVKEVLKQMVMQHGLEEVMEELVDIVMTEMESDPEKSQLFETMESYMGFNPAEKTN